MPPNTKTIRWLNDFLPDPLCQESHAQVKFGDLVSMTIVDVFETDLNGKLLSYCPTFDNRCVAKTNPTIERIYKESNKLLTTVNVVRHSEAGKTVEKAASALCKYAGQAAFTVAETVKETITKQVIERTQSGGAVVPSQVSSTSAYTFFQNMNSNTASQTLRDAMALSTSNSSPTAVNPGPQLELEPRPTRNLRNPDYISDDETTGTAMTGATRETQ